jgi:hypothetical protein
MIVQLMVIIWGLYHFKIIISLYFTKIKFKQIITREGKLLIGSQ